MSSFYKDANIRHVFKKKSTKTNAFVDSYFLKKNFRPCLILKTQWLDQQSESFQPDHLV